jgi:integrase
MGEHIFKRGKIWYGWTYDPNGGQVRFSTGCTDKVAARLVLAQREREAADPDAARKKSATLGDAFDLLVKDRKALVKAGKRSRRTINFYDSHARPWYVFAGRKIKGVAINKMDDEFSLNERNNLAELGRRLALLDAGDERFVDEFTVHRRENQTSEHTIAHDRGTLRAALKIAKRARIWSGDVESIFGRFDLGYQPSQHWITHEEAARLLDATILAHRRGYLSFMLATGAELAAVERARREDINFELVRVRGTKNANRDRFVPIVTQWQRDLLAYVKANADGNEGLLFSPWGSALRSIKQTCKRANVKHMSRKSFRHTFSAWMKQEGVPNSELYIAMGHASTAMLERIYGKPDGAELAKAMAGSIAVRRTALTVIEGGKGAKAEEKAAG